MKTPIVVSLVAAAALLAGPTGLPGNGAAAAAEADICRIPEPVVQDVEKKPRRVPNMQPTTWKRLQQAQELVSAEQYAEGIELLEAMVPRDGRRSRYNAAELGQVHNLLGFAYWELERADKTIEHYEKVLAQVPEIPEEIELLVLFQLSKIYFMQAQEQKQEDLASRWYASSLAKMGEWIDKSDDPGAEPFYFIAQIYYQLKDFESGIKCLETTIAVARAAGAKAKEPWWRMLQYMYYEQENWPKVEEILEILVKDYPKREYWVTLASVYAETGQEEKQLLALEAAHAGGYLDKETDLRAYHALLIQAGVSNRATKYLTRGFDEGIIKRTADDLPETIEDFEAAGKLEPEGKTFDLLTSLYLDSDQYSKCREAAQKALELGGLANRLRTKVNLGFCEFYLDNLTAARKVFSEVRREARQQGERRMESMAGDWIKYIDSEATRRDEMRRAGLAD